MEALRIRYYFTETGLVSSVSRTIHRVLKVVLPSRITASSNSLSWFLAKSPHLHHKRYYQQVQSCLWFALYSSQARRNSRRSTGWYLKMHFCQNRWESIWISVALLPNQSWNGTSTQAEQGENRHFRRVSSGCLERFAAAESGKSESKLRKP